MRVGVFTPLLSQLSAEDVFKKVKGYHIDTVELGTGNYPGGAHCKLSMLENKSELNDFKSLLADNGISISALMEIPLSASRLLKSLSSLLFSSMESLQWAPPG